MVFLTTHDFGKMKAYLVILIEINRKSAGILLINYHSGTKDTSNPTVNLCDFYFLVVLAQQWCRDSGRCVCHHLYMCLWCFSRCFVRSAVCTSAGDRRTERARERRSTILHHHSCGNMCVRESIQRVRERERAREIKRACLLRKWGWIFWAP